MPWVWMDDVPRVQTVGSGGIGVSPPVPVEAVDKVGETGREMYEVSVPSNEIPNPGTAEQGATIVNDNGSWGYSDGDSGGGSESGSGNLVLHMDEDTNALDKTWQEIYDAFSVGAYVVYLQNLGSSEAPRILQKVVTEVGYSPEEEEDGEIYPEEYYIHFGISHFTCDSSTGYPTLSDGGPK